MTLVFSVFEFCLAHNTKKRKSKNIIIIHRGLKCYIFLAFNSWGMLLICITHFTEGDLFVFGCFIHCSLSIRTPTYNFWKPHAEMSTKIDIKSIKKSSTRTEWTITAVSAFSFSKPFCLPCLSTPRLLYMAHCSFDILRVCSQRNIILIDRINKWAVSNAIRRSDFSSSSLLFSHRALTNRAYIEIAEWLEFLAVLNFNQQSRTHFNAIPQRILAQNYWPDSRGERKPRAKRWFHQIL